MTMAQDGAPTGYEAFVPAIRIMSGQKPKVNTIFVPLPFITDTNIDGYYDQLRPVFHRRRESSDAHTVERLAFGFGRPEKTRTGRRFIAEKQKLG
jgi:hypothetical protein